MKKSFMSISMLVISISMVAMFICSLAASAQNPSSSSKFIYDKKDTVETVYTLDETGRFLTPKLKYEYQETGTGKVKIAYRWNTEKAEWLPYYSKTISESELDSVVEYALWDSETESFSRNPQKAVYHKGANQDILACVFYKWNASDRLWVVEHDLLLKEYLAYGIGSVN